MPLDDTAVLPVFAAPAETKRKTLPWLLAGAAAVVGLCCCGGVIMAANGLSPTAAPTASTTPGNRFVDGIPNPSPSAPKPITPTPPAAEETPADPATTVRTPPGQADGHAHKQSRTRSHHHPAKAAAPADDRPSIRHVQRGERSRLRPIRRGIDPEYAWYRDPNDDGLVCERR
ncbi:hypothetical protein Q2K19_31760 [Micromonospora soli]|uniref:excalibur calcium-binding domain-containing protein n=1 Tax=Micromonospora sp. NBRC 110009 TaxID=3061627 RepID=UPI0026720320|nr:excalibur calcium-binding domain-containing protein [Micromonospora sp. NBRC 110009]WKT98669.1 hypothetical protein Q2K19_31760 [Micromonospora sp. NBRC 110009]